ncbi:hypothetical protein FGO68_gene6161 [Halteria grandinella]|uniref:Mevalonate kinase n=1 Tax=Halteria grandinella TaxID=5974 RepID=A0A8J8T0K1_HALGN|nr:hypothetical protein FGO68_gene6161 [Halteria grandinella]
MEGKVSKERKIGIAKVRTPGKVIISGEHSVVYHKSALVMAINLFTEAQVTVFSREEQPPSIEVKIFQRVSGEVICLYEPGETNDQKEAKLIEHIIQDCNLIPQHKITLLVEISSQIPIGAGLGSSAAYSIALSGALYLGIQLYLGNQCNLTKASLNHKVSRYADVLERLIHTNPSGVDVAISLNGGMLTFLKGETPAQNQITLLPDASNSLNMILVNTNKARNSKLTIEAVMKLRDEQKERFENLIAKIGKLTELVIEQYTIPEQQDQLLLLQMIEENHFLLKELGVSCTEIETILQILSKFGISAKLTGAGGGGCVVGFITKEQVVEDDSLQKELKQSGFSLFSGIELSQGGMTFEISTEKEISKL